MMNFEAYVQSFQKLYLEAKGQAAPSLPSLSESLAEIPRRILIFAPHPDDECLMAGLALRAKLEAGSRVGVVPFTYGSNLPRRPERKIELENALLILEFEKVDPRPEGEESLKLPDLLRAFELYHPDAVVIPHELDGHATHIQCSKLVKQAATQWTNAKKKRLQVFETEFWQSMSDPNLLLPLSDEIATCMGRALICHVGEVARNPYQLTLPAWLMDQARRGSEIEKGSKKGEAVFAQIFRHSEL